MNLLAKSLGQLAVLAVALFFFSCEDPTSLGYQNPNKKFNVQYVEIPLSSSVVLTDSLVTDNKLRNGVPTAGGSTLVGRYTDEVMGTVKAESFLQIYRSTGATTKLPSAAVFDSVTFQMKLNFYSYGFTGVQTEKFTVHEITGDSLNSMRSHYYYSSSTLAYDPTMIGEISVQVDYDSLKKELSKQSNQRDTLLARGKLSDTFGQKIFGYAQASEFKTNAEIKQFLSDFKGISLVPSQSNAILGLDIFSSFSKIVLHYHTATDTLEAALGFSTAGFTNIQTDRSATSLAGVLPYQSSDPGELRFIQGGSPVLTKVDLENFYNVIDTIDNALINSAELVIENVESPLATPVHGSLVARVMNENSQFSNLNTADEQNFRIYSASLAGDGVYLNVRSDVASQNNPYATLGYSSDKKSYSVFLTLFAQSLFRNKNSDTGINANRIKYLGLIQNSINSGPNVNRSVFSKNAVKLRISYTKPTNIDL
jgi:hypothetical protein